MTSVSSHTDARTNTFQYCHSERWSGNATLGFVHNNLIRWPKHPCVSGHCTPLPRNSHDLSRRLLASPDMGTINATLVLLLNSIHAEEQALYASILNYKTFPWICISSRLTSPNGQRIVVRLLDRTEEWAINESEKEETEEAFTISWAFPSMTGSKLITNAIKVSPLWNAFWTRHGQHALPFPFYVGPENVFLTHFHWQTVG